MSDVPNNLRDPENGQYVSLKTLFERERVEHSRDHEQERVVAKETAQRLEREVEQTALRLERVVKETAIRIEKAVATALAAVAETARVHADAHAKEHQAHERIHTVEEANREKAFTQNDKRLDGMNEFRDALSDQSARAVTRELFDSKIEALSTQMGKMEKRMAYYAGAAAMGGFLFALIFRLLTSP